MSIMAEKDLYRTYSSYLKEKYQKKVHKIPINLPVTCPNRDGTLGTEGCIYCGEEGAGFENLPSTMTVAEQIETNLPRMKKKFKAGAFIAYFQNFTNTYLPLEQFANYVETAACFDEIVEVAISTRPDCIHDKWLHYLSEFQERTGIHITLELGLQTVNYHTLKTIKRGHTLAEFVDAVLRIRPFHFDICTHLILNLPGDTLLDSQEASKLLSVLEVDQVKLHSLYIVPDTELERMFQEDEFSMISLEEYVRRVVIFLEYLDPDMVVQRLVSRMPEGSSVWNNWGMSWWKIVQRIEAEMRNQGSYQGRKFHYRHGPALRPFLTED